ncbi:hypothetical protein Bhyg_04828 [Pseudolycoriella hygida]|uniref:Uncharacterized protein n=1 Tax=Pseudolycoriella hygida TaxID=35572 RepID=A0A9Q0NG58_9DIPT|nr:hypothetical protein Bhyg_04828 [Pseudolycoriella hygida]
MDRLKISSVEHVDIEPAEVENNFFDVPWMVCAEDECAKIAAAFEKDMFSEELKQLLLTCGGKEVDQRIIAVLRNASELGFMDVLKEDL